MSNSNYLCVRPAVEAPSVGIKELMSDEQNGAIVLSEFRDSYGYIIHANIEQEHYDAAIELARMAPFQKPSAKLLNSILYDAMLVCKDKTVTTKAWLYVMQLLDFYPPSNSERRSYYRTALFESEKRGRSMWDIFSHCISCTLKKKGHSDGKPFCDKNCDILFDYLVEVFKRDFEQSIHDKIAPDQWNSSCKKLIIELFWPIVQPGCTSGNYTEFISHLNFVLSCDNVDMEMADHLLSLFCLAAECVQQTLGLHGFNILYSTNTASLVGILRGLCNNDAVMANKNTLKLILCSIDKTWLRIQICENILNNMVLGPSGRLKPSLRKLVWHYMFPGVKSELKKRQRNVVKRSLTGKTVIHDLCASDSPGSLANILKSRSVENIKLASFIYAEDDVGWTPLHEACFAKSFLCTKLLLQGLRVESCGLDIRAQVDATDDLGRTPLHFAVIKNDCNSASLLLHEGGYELALIEDAEGNKPLTLIHSKDMAAVFLKHVPETNPEDTEWLLEKAGTITVALKRLLENDAKGLDPCIREMLTKNCPPFFIDILHYPSYLLCLHFLVLDYISFFDLNSLLKPGESDKANLISVAENHFQKQFDIKPQIDDITRMLDDLLLLQNWSLIIRTFCNCFQKGVLKHIAPDCSDELQYFNILTKIWYYDQQAFECSLEMDNVVTNDEHVETKQENIDEQDIIIPYEEKASDTLDSNDKSLVNQVEWSENNINKELAIMQTEDSYEHVESKMPHSLSEQALDPMETYVAVISEKSEIVGSYETLSKQSVNIPEEQVCISPKNKNFTKYDFSEVEAQCNDSSVKQLYIVQAHEEVGEETIGKQVGSICRSVKNENTHTLDTQEAEMVSQINSQMIERSDVTDSQEAINKETGSVPEDEREVSPSLQVSHKSIENKESSVLGMKFVDVSAQTGIQVRGEKYMNFSQETSCEENATTPEVKMDKTSEDKNSVNFPGSQTVRSYFSLKEESSHSHDSSKQFRAMQSCKDRKEDPQISEISEKQNSEKSDFDCSGDIGFGQLGKILQSSINSMSTVATSVLCAMNVNISLDDSELLGSSSKDSQYSHILSLESEIANIKLKTSQMEDVDQTACETVQSELKSEHDECLKTSPTKEFARLNNKDSVGIMETVIEAPSPIHQEETIHDIQQYGVQKNVEDLVVATGLSHTAVVPVNNLYRASKISKRRDIKKTLGRPLLPISCHKELKATHKKKRQQKSSSLKQFSTRRSPLTVSALKQLLDKLHETKRKQLYKSKLYKMSVMNQMLASSSGSVKNETNMPKGICSKIDTSSPYLSHKLFVGVLMERKGLYQNIVESFRKVTTIHQRMQDAVRRKALAVKQLTNYF